ncbi:hypothetical protein BAUCODRAFT_464900 [Baudoinia panamericana UAMH 10762]|uniref:Zn(2)-C6 fungal-type domain-containing protein n=1 Tax=Baudoinia panamericana (strain UAMH 10762) TaxID=717646 RepID=M2NAI4_BAUPA|nr:uncharacterized protein BAUCODRAFT_464900 [Baudoinia panamericana UAMH 10762]EMC96144.1 hypothetical protein BAUCODRAFT_464900 [Baudoinia panamericana UAMH 10762]
MLAVCGFANGYTLRFHSCVECRQRKIRCLWPSEDAEVCNNCLEKRRRCVPQQVLSKDPGALRLTSRDRIAKLESNVSSLWKLVRSLENRLAAHDGHHPNPTVEPDAVVEHMAEAGYDTESSDETSAANQPTHLRQLFQDGPLDWKEHPAPDTPQRLMRHASVGRQQRARGALRKILPSREEAAAIADQSTTWIGLNESLFSIGHIPADKAAISRRWESAHEDSAEPTEIAMLLLTLALTAVQMPADAMPKSPIGLMHGHDFVHSVSDAVESLIVQDDTLAASIDGLEVSIIWARLQLVVGKISKMWLTLRRVVALAELIGLPRASNKVPASMAPTPPEDGARKAEAAMTWRAICVVDRLCAMMFNLPSGTTNYPLITDEPVIQDGELVPRLYMAQLADISIGVQDIDHLYASGISSAELCDKVLKVDQQLRHLASLAPPAFWAQDADVLTPSSILHQFHRYLTARTHIQLALKNGAGSQYAYSYVVCSEACTTYARRYTTVRRLLPRGFFASRVLDLQALTAAVFLVHKRHLPQVTMGMPSIQNSAEDAELIEQVIQTMEDAAPHAGGDYARQAAQTLRSMNALLDDTNSMNSGDEPHTLTMRVPLLGRVHVSRRPLPRSSDGVLVDQQAGPSQIQLDGMPSAQHNTLGYSLPQQPQPVSNVYNGSESMPWSMEISDVLPFLADSNLGADQWLPLGDGLGASL